MKLAKPFHDSGSKTVRRLDVIPSLALQVYMQFLAQGREARAAYENGLLVIRTEGKEEEIRLPAGPDLECIIEAADPGEIVPHKFRELLKMIRAGNTEYFEKFKNRIVLVGLTAEQDRRSVLNGRELYGVEIQASAVSNLLQGSFVTPLGYWPQYLVILTMGILGALMRLHGGRMTGREISLSRIFGNIPLLPPILAEAPISLALILFILLYFAFASAVFQWNRVLLDFSYELFTLCFTYWIVGVVLSRVTLAPQKPLPLDQKRKRSKTQNKLKEKTA